MKPLFVPYYYWPAIQFINWDFLSRCKHTYTCLHLKKESYLSSQQPGVLGMYIFVYIMYIYALPDKQANTINTTNVRGVYNSLVVHCQCRTVYALKDCCKVST